MNKATQQPPMSSIGADHDTGLPGIGGKRFQITLNKDKDFLRNFEQELLKTMEQAYWGGQQVVMAKPRRYGMQNLQNRLTEQIAAQKAKTDEEKLESFLILHLEQTPNPRNLTMKQRIRNLADWAEKTGTPVVKETKYQNHTGYELTEAGKKKIYGDSEQPSGFVFNHDRINQQWDSRWRPVEEVLYEQAYRSTMAQLDTLLRQEIKNQNEKQPSWADLARVYKARGKDELVSVLHEMQGQSGPSPKRSYLEEDSASVLCVWVRNGVHHQIRVPAGSPIPTLVEIDGKTIPLITGTPGPFSEGNDASEAFFKKPGQ